MFQWNRNISRIHLNGKQEITNNQQQHVQQYTKKIHERWILNKFGFVFLSIFTTSSVRYSNISALMILPIYHASNACLFCQSNIFLLLLTLFEYWCHKIPRLSLQTRVSYTLYFTLWDCSLSIQSSVRYVVNCHCYNCTLEAHIRSFFLLLIIWTFISWFFVVFLCSFSIIHSKYVNKDI